jgi:DNA-binding GntR family transcriptional regulator
MVLAMALRRPEINRVSVIPIYEQLEEDLARQIEAGTLEPGEKLPGDRDFAIELGIGYQTVRRVMLALASRGLIERRQGKGTFVRSGHPEGT